ncbi:hypothetical protein [Asaia sp. HN010]|uniref:hypothetical protein n=1 Tax=Asaia sp. HN010 TaxID=3081233 RepID=UPI0030177310
MSETTQATLSPAGTAQNFILFRETALFWSQPSFTDDAGDKVTPDPVIISQAGQVVATQMIFDAAGLMIPDGFGMVADPDGKYPVGSVYQVSAGAVTG